VSNIDLLFPSRAIEGLQNIRGENWEKLVRFVVAADPLSIERIAFVLLMVRLGGCSNCQSDSFRAMRGCILCSSTTIKRYKNSDQSLLELFEEAKLDVCKYLNEV
jgi:hypothetical protein